MKDKLHNFIDAQNRLVMREWDALGDVDGNSQPAISLAEKQGERFAKGLARIGWKQRAGRFEQLN